MLSKKLYPNRKSIRLQGYDYSMPGGYFVSLVTKKHTKFFGEIVNEDVNLNEVGIMVQDEWLLLPERFLNLQLDEFIVMPDHFHGILFLTVSASGAVSEEWTTSERTTTRVAHTTDGEGKAITRFAHTEDLSNRETDIATSKFGQIIGAFKSITTNEYISGVKEKGWKPFDGQIWHRNYHDRIIRNEKELNNIRTYIRNNPVQWKKEI